MKFHVINLGCVRNLVDAQNLITCLKEKKNKLVDLEQAQAVIINTCGFIEDAKKESIDTILDVIDLKKQGKVDKVIIAGCLAQRYHEELSEEFHSEIDAIMGVPEFEQWSTGKTHALSPKHYRYVKICEGCYHCCSFCAIPRIKGSLRSRPMDSILNEIRSLDGQGVKEVILIGQDITAYGLDLYKQKRLAFLLRQIIKEIRNIRWVRLLYTFPSHITDDLLDLIAEDNLICRYLDVPLQHINSHVLKRMNRPLTKRSTVALIKKIRKKIPRVAVRTSFIVGFPGETAAIFEELVSYVQDTRFDKVGVFTYSKEENTPAFKYRSNITKPVMTRRYNKLMRVQQKISREKLREFVGKKVDVIIDEKDKEAENMYVGRTEYDAPEVDGLVYVHSRRKLPAGKIVPVLITDTLEYDLMGEY